ncbi:unnamed protein product [Peniophora sp. CBMAI 1063]|nr:unnamed protein product [Peniophora sp. CBMAI 1063]
MTTPPLPPHLKAIKHRGEFEYPIQVWYLNLSVLALATVINGVTIAWTKLSPRFFPRGGSTRQDAVAVSRVPAALLAGWRILAFRWRVPLGSLVDASLFEAFVVCVYMAALLIWEFVHTNNLAPAFWSNRAAHIAAAQLPLMPALSAKNNVIGLLTGISHERLNVLHRAAGRCIYVLVWIHFWGRWKIGFYGPDDIPHMPWQQVGAVSGAAYSLIIILSLRPFRRWSYEIFYFTHVVMVIVFIIASCIHTTTPGFNYYVWPVWVVWGFERIVRGFRYLVINFILAPRSSTPSSAALSLITPDTLCVTLTRRMPLGWKPGQHAFLAFPRISSFPLESHPFSIANIPKRGSGSEQELMFMIRARDGVTGRMLRAAAARPNGQVSVQIDAPYGMPTDLAPYRTSVLVAGGTGVSYTLPLLLDVIQRSADGKTRTKRVRFVWAVRSEAYLNWIAPYLRDTVSSCPSDLSLEINLFVTDSPSDAGSMEEKRSLPELAVGEDLEAGGGLTKGSPANPALAQMGDILNSIKGRPDVNHIISEEISRGQGPVAVEVSGPHSLVDAARSSVSSVQEIIDVLKGGPTVNFHAEVFKY